ncbi:hypothetical protein NKH18_15155 [Streptomyces sp. M10(2022)]
MDPNRYFEITYPAGGIPSWSMTVVDAVRVAETPAGGSKAAPWTCTAPVRAGYTCSATRTPRCSSAAASRGRRPRRAPLLRDSRHLQSCQNQRGTWAEIDVNGWITNFGSREWSESTRSYFDVSSFAGRTDAVRHFRLNVDGGHVLANLRPYNASWVRYDSEFQPIAHGTRHKEEQFEESQPIADGTRHQKAWYDRFRPIPTGPASG